MGAAIPMKTRVTTSMPGVRVEPLALAELLLHLLLAHHLPVDLAPLAVDFLIDSVIRAPRATFLPPMAQGRPVAKAWNAALAGTRQTKGVPAVRGAGRWTRGRDVIPAIGAGPGLRLETDRFTVWETGRFPILRRQS
ncbi:hypothetical protein ACFS5L_29055 [Streptomyces phyllanthi]|uniref:hypothetical protein n=1 Tax=Streptomyces phyllanthi TaxID=1803180 RepID=UPI001D15B418|nr:hypothetical protein [Streptomyces phyllanthi]